MKNKWLSLLLCLLLILPYGTAAAASAESTYTVTEVEGFCDGIIGYKAGDAQQFIDNELCQNAGIYAEFYIIALSQRGGYRFDKYEKALLNYLKNTNVPSATSREKYALALIACGSTDGYISEVADEAIGGQGLMSLVFGLHILNNGYQSRLYTPSTLANTILSYQLSDGGWAVMGSTGDVDVTAMTIQALAPYYNVYSDVHDAIDRGLNLLSSRQLSSGGFITMGAENCESACQVLCALSALGIDQNRDTRFIKNGHTVLDAILRYRNADGSFSHDGSGFNETATIQALYSMVSYTRFCYGRGPLYILDRRNPAAVQPKQNSVTAKNNAGNSGSNHSNNNNNNNSNHNNSANSNSANNNSGGNNSNGPQNEPQPQQNEIIYIGGSAYIKATDSSGRDVTVAATDPTAATSAPTAAPTQPSSASVTEPPTFQPYEGTIATADTATTGSGPSYKLYAVLAVILLSGGAAGVLVLLKKRGKKHFIALLIITAAAVAFILLTNFESAERYHQTAEKAEPVGEVTMIIRCDVLADESDLPDGIPADGVILNTTTFTISEGESAYDILLEASKTYDIPIDNRGSDAAAYIAGIAHVYEYDYGELSGWMYQVNGVFPRVGCQSYILENGDTIEWRYTRDIGHDIGE